MIYFQPTLNYTALWKFFWNFTCWFKLLKVLVPTCGTTFRCLSCFQRFLPVCRGWMHELAVIHQRRHCLFMVIWLWDAGVTYLLLQLELLTFKSCSIAVPCFFATPSNPRLWTTVLRCIQLHFSVLHYSHLMFFQYTIQLSLCISSYCTFSDFCNLSDHFSVNAFFRTSRFQCSQLTIGFCLSPVTISAFHPVVFSTSTPCWSWSTSTSFGNSSSSPFPSFLFLGFCKLLIFEHCVQSKDKIKSLQVCVCVCTIPALDQYLLNHSYFHVGGSSAHACVSDISHTSFSTIFLQWLCRQSIAFECVWYLLALSRVLLFNSFGNWIFTLLPFCWKWLTVKKLLDSLLILFKQWFAYIFIFLHEYIWNELEQFWILFEDTY